MTPLKAARRSIRGRPPWLFGGGGASSRRTGSIRCQRRSGASQMVPSGLMTRFVRPMAAPPEVVSLPQDTKPDDVRAVPY
jgi:hypothetical protein